MGQTSGTTFLERCCHPPLVAKALLFYCSSAAKRKPSAGILFIVFFWGEIHVHIYSLTKLWQTIYGYILIWFMSACSWRHVIVYRGKVLWSVRFRLPLGMVLKWTRSNGPLMLLFWCIKTAGSSFVSYEFTWVFIFFKKNRFLSLLEPGRSVGPSIDWSLFCSCPCARCPGCSEKVFQWSSTQSKHRYCGWEGPKAFYDCCVPSRVLLKR